MNNNNERVFAFYNLGFSAYGGKYPVLPPYDVQKHLTWLIAAFNEKTVYLFASGRKAYRICRIKEEPDHLILLVRFVDGTVRDHTIEDMRSGVEQEIQKTDSQGDSYTAHIYISKRPQDSKLKMIVEVNHGFLLGNISQMLSGLVKEYLKKHPLLVKIEDPTGAKKGEKAVIIKKWPLFEARGALRDDFENESEGAKVTEFKLVSTKRGAANLEGISDVYEKKTSVTIGVDKGITGTIMGAIRSLAGNNKDRYQEIAVTYKRDSSKPVTARFDSADLSLIDGDRLIKKIIITAWAAKIKHAYSDIQHEVVAAFEDIKNG